MSKIEQAQISEIPFPECVKMRRGMYISDINQAVTEIVDNAVDESYAGYCDTIATVVMGDRFIVQDNGRGIPCTPMKNNPDKTQVEAAFTTLHAGGKFGLKDGYSKKTSGMHGVGGSCVQALSSEMKVLVVYDGNKYETNFKDGYLSEHTRIVENGLDVNEHGTTVEFTLNPDLWKESEPLNKKGLIKRLKEIAYLNPGLTMYNIIDTDDYKEENTFYFPEGLKQYLEELTYTKNKVSDIVNLSKEIGDVEVQLALVYTESYSSDILTFCNNMRTVDNGSHLEGFNKGLSDAIKDYMAQYKIDFEMKQEDIREGLYGIVAIRVSDPNFEGQAKTKLKMSSVRNAVKDCTYEIIFDYLDKNPKVAKSIIEKIKLASEARIKAQQARENMRKNKDSSKGRAEKLADCTWRIPEKTEIYLVEGDSAGGSAKQGRDRKFQAILPVFGKISNVEKLRLEQVLDSDKLAEFSKAAKVKFGEECKVEDCRYHKIIIMSDADVDGAHISCLWMTLFYRYLRPLIEAGFLYMACPPLYKVTYKEGSKEVIYYAYDDVELNSMIKEKGQPKNIQRFKGLGEMNPDQLWETTMNPETRKLIQVTIEDAEAAEEIVSLCMSKDCSARKEWITENAQFADIDV